MKTLTPALQAAVEQIRDAKQDWLRHWEQAAVDLAAAIAGRLVRGELSRRPEISLAWIREALELAAGSGEIAIHLHPADQQALERQVDATGRGDAPARPRRGWSPTKRSRPAAAASSRSSAASTCSSKRSWNGSSRS